jgi:hypothetical protein
MTPGIDPQFGQTPQIQCLHVVRRGLQDDLILIVMLQPVRVFAVPAIGRTPAGLRIGRTPRLRTERAEKGRRMKCPCAHLKIVRLLNNAALVSPEAMEGKDQVLERHG